MRGTMRRWRTTALAAVVLALVLSGASAEGSARPAAASVPALPAAVVAMAERSAQAVVRHDARVMVGTVTVPRSLRAAAPTAPATVYRVRVAGRFPPRALRYTVLAGGAPVGYGTPTSDMRAVTAVTTSSSVLDGPITVSYGAGATPLSGIVGRMSGPGAALRAARSGGASGKLAVTRTVYDLGNQAFQPSGITGKVELVADVHYPTGLPGGPYPLIVFLHGNHAACYSASTTTYQWPCPAGYQPLPNYTGYDYIASKLASFGYIVVSISGNGVNVLGNQVSDTGMRQRGELIEKHLDLWKMWSTAGGAPFGTTFVGKVDMSRIGVMGHSRGGEGAVWSVIVDRERATPYGIDAVLPLAPVDFDRQTVNGVPLEVILPYCDGDVSDLQGVHFFDDARYRLAGDSTPKGTIVVMGANHNYFNTVWSPSGGYPGAFNDGLSGCPGRISETAQRTTGLTYISDFFRRYLGGTLSLDKVFTGVKTPAVIAPVKTLVTYLPPDLPVRRIDLDRFTGSASLSTDTLGGAVTSTGLTVADWCAETAADPCVPGTFQKRDIHLTGLPQAALGWAGSTGSVRFAIPAGAGDVSALNALQFRVTPNPSYAASTGTALQNLTVELDDAAGHTATVAASAVNRDALTYPPGIPAGHVIMNQIRFPLTAFTGVNLSNLTAVRIVFGLTAKGTIDVSDLAFTRGAQ